MGTKVDQFMLNALKRASNIVAVPWGVNAVAMLLAISWQEARWSYRRQIGGPARGLWQFEQGGGVTGVLTHPMTRAHAAVACATRGVASEPAVVCEQLARDDTLAACFARLLLYSLPQALPGRSDDESIGWEQYLAAWRPGAPKPMTWPEAWANGWAEARRVWTN